MSIDKKALEMKRMNASCVWHPTWTHRHAVRGGDGSEDQGLAGQARSAGAEDRLCSNSSREAEELEGAGEERVSAGQDSGDLCGETTEVADADAWVWVSVRATRGFAGARGKHSVEMEVTPAGTGRRRVIGNSRASSSENRNSLRSVLDIVIGMGVAASLFEPAAR